MFPQGAQNVRCARCGHITAVPPAGGSTISTPPPVLSNLCRTSQVVDSSASALVAVSRWGYGTAGVQQPHVPGCPHVPPGRKPSAVLHLRHSQLCHGGDVSLPASHLACVHVVVHRGFSAYVAQPTNNTADSWGMQANQIGHLVCAHCHMTLMFAHGAQSVKCAVCNYVTAVTPSSMAQAQQPQRWAGAASYLRFISDVRTPMCKCTLKPMCTRSLPDAGTNNPAASNTGPSTGSPLTQSVVVENPPSLDKDGNEVRSGACWLLWQLPVLKVVAEH